VTRPDPDARRDSPVFHFPEQTAAARYTRIRELFPADAASRLPQFLEEAADPEQSVLQLEVLLERHPAEAFAAFQASAQALRSCVALFGASQWLGQTLLHNSDLLQTLARPAGLARSRSIEDFREQLARFGLRSHDTPLPVLLTRFKRREYVRIFTRELLGLASLAEITGEISALSDVLIERALAHCESELRRRYQGWPQLRSVKGRVYPARFSVLSLGKLGGDELNYSSDVDLLFLRDDAEDAGVLSISAGEFFTRLAQDLTAILSSVNAEGQVFRVDLRLRPQGTSGEIVVGCAQALRYYRSVAQDWELQALLKLRFSAGDSTLAREFIEQAQKLIYCESISLSAIQTAARSLERIRSSPGPKGARNLDVKSGAGGLREIEFVVQCLQRVHGGGEPWLRSSGTLFALQKLHDNGHIGDAEFRELCEGYELLRSIEHRLQCRQGAQTHRLPEAARDQAALFRSLNRNVGCAEELQQLMKSVSDLCARVLRLGAEEGSQDVTLPVSLGAPGAEHLRRELSARSAVLAKVLATAVGNPALRNLQRFLAACATGEERRRATLRNVPWIERALPVFAQSELATDILARHPEDIGALFLDLDREVGRSISEQLRIDYRRCILRSLGRSLLETTSVWEVLGAQSECLDGIIQRATRALDAPEEFAVFAVGRVGTCELDVVADADLVFVRTAECTPVTADRCARDLVAMLSGYTREGSVIAVDTRLRPHGNEGELVVSSRQLAQYFESEAKAWEVLAFSKLRFVAGSERVASEVHEARAALQTRFAADPEFVSELRTMRLRIANSGGVNSFKTGLGGLYDLDFLVGLLEARAGLPAAGKQLFVRLEALVNRELLSEEQGRDLLRAAELFRRVDHAIRALEGRSRTWLPESDNLRKSIVAVVGRSDLELTLRAEMQFVREIFEPFFRD
jgi:[glutamine synthetase] adenylyltransferase / [glutamine synthetase]-adenylyl-L-tyrosine phosphorylase